MRRTATFLLVALSVCLMAPAARSQPASAPAHNPDAEALFKKGNELIDEGDFERARIVFLAVSALVSSSTNLYNLGYCEVRSAHYAEGMNHLRQFLRGPHVTPEARSRVIDYMLPLAIKHVAQLQIETKAGASVAIDDTAVGVAPLPDPIAVSPGKHHVTATLNGAASSVDVNVVEGQTVTVPLSNIGISAAPGAAPAAPIAPPSPTITTAAAPSEPDHSTRPAPLRIWLTAGLGVAAVGALVSGVYFAEQSNNDANSATAITTSSRSPCLVPTSSNCMSLGSDLNSQRTDETISLVMYTGAGVLAAGAVLSWFFLPKTAVAESSPGVSALPLVGPGLLGIQWSKRF